MTEPTKPELDHTRRRLVQGIGAGLALPAFGVSPAVIAAPTARPWITDGVQSGDMLADRAVIWNPRSITLRDIDGASVFSKNLEPQHA